MSYLPSSAQLLVCPCPGLAKLPVCYLPGSAPLLVCYLPGSAKLLVCYLPRFIQAPGVLLARFSPAAGAFGTRFSSAASAFGVNFPVQPCPCVWCCLSGSAQLPVQSETHSNAVRNTGDLICCDHILPKDFRFRHVLLDHDGQMVDKLGLNVSFITFSRPGLWSGSVCPFQSQQPRGSLVDGSDVRLTARGQFLALFSAFLFSPLFSFFFFFLFFHFFMVFHLFFSGPFLDGVLFWKGGGLFLSFLFHVFWCVFPLFFGTFFLLFFSFFSMFFFPFGCFFDFFFTFCFFSFFLVSFFFPLFCCYRVAFSWTLCCVLWSW